MRFPIDLIPIVMREINVIVGMDWLSRHRPHFECENQRIVVQTPSGGVLTIFGDGRKDCRRYVRWPKQEDMCIVVASASWLM